VTEREWREAADLQPRRVWLAVVLVTAAVLRFWQLGSGIPYAIGVDEPEIMTRTVAMMKSGDLNPHFFDYPGFIFYLHLPVVILRFMVGAAQGQWSALDAVGPADFYLWSRAVTATLGTLTVLLVYLAGSRWGGRHALLGAGVLAVLPMHVRESHYVLTDVPMTFFVTLAWVLSLSAHERAAWTGFALAGAAAGLATAIKYTAGLSLALPLLALWMTIPLHPSRTKAAVATVGAFAVAFLGTAPYTLLDLPAFLNAFAYLMTHFQPRGPELEAGWIVYLKHLRLNLQWPATILLAAGVGLAIVRAVRGPGRVRWTLLIVFPLLVFWSIADSRQIYARYLMPLMPFVCLLVGIAVVSGVSLLRRFAIPRAVRTVLIVSLTVAAVLPPARASLAYLSAISRTSTLDLAWRWISEHAPRGTAVVLERHELRLPEDRYRARYVLRLVDEPLEAYRREGVRYLVANASVFGAAVEHPDREPGAAYRTLFRSVREVARFSPSQETPGPEIRILAVE
jgi:4-amino-4-deoxy-L-arabinose transferase-like glycosyltransferase